MEGSYKDALDNSLWWDDLKAIGDCIEHLTKMPYPLSGTLDYYDSNGDLTAKIWYDSEGEQWLADIGSWR